MRDAIEIVLVNTQKDPKKFLDREYVMGAFDETLWMLPPFREHLNHAYEEKQSNVLGMVILQVK